MKEEEQSKEMLPKRVMKFIYKKFKKIDRIFNNVKDYRDKRRITHKLSDILKSVTIGLVSGKRSLRELEDMTGKLRSNPYLGVKNKISDTTIWKTLVNVKKSDIEKALVKQVKEVIKDKGLSSEFGVNVVTIDGKSIGSPRDDSCKYTKKWKQRRAYSRRVCEYRDIRVLRAAVTSSETKLIIGQCVIPRKRNEVSECLPFLKQLYEQYKRTNLLEFFDFDAQFCNKKIADGVISHGSGYIMSLKKNQKKLFEKSKELLSWHVKLKPAAETEWERRGSSHIKRKLFRIRCIPEYNFWEHTKQIWLVRQVTKDKKGNEVIEDRYFITSMPWDKIGGKQILMIVRGHWGIENDCFNSLDLQWREDDMPIARKKDGLLVISLLRCIAYNILQYLRKRHLKNKRKPKKTYIPWKKLFEIINDGLKFYYIKECFALD